MAETDTPGAATDPAPAVAFRCLLRASRVATLATTDKAGQPFASLVTPAFLPDLTPALLLSTLSEHTRQLQAEPRCALLVVGAAPEANPQTAPRITLICQAALDTEAATRARYLAVHPYAALYADFGDFAFWRLSIIRASFVGGFARAGRLSATALQPSPASVAAVLDAEPSILAHCNADHADALGLIAGGEAGWRMVTADVDGCDLALGDEKTQRVAWDAPVEDSGGIRRALVLKVEQARQSGMA